MSQISQLSDCQGEWECDLLEDSSQVMLVKLIAEMSDSTLGLHFWLLNW